jgi:hypothetical protein
MTARLFASAGAAAILAGLRALEAQPKRPVM